MSTPLVHPFPILHGGEFVRHGGSGLAADDRLVHGDAWPLHGGDPPRHRRLLRHGGVLVLHPDTAPPEPSWTDLGEDTVIAADVLSINGAPTARGRTIQTLQPYGARIYLGYGDYENNSGPTDLRYYDLSSPGFASAVSAWGSESILCLRALGGKLWASGQDPTNSYDPDYIVCDGTTCTSASKTVIDEVHLWDFAEFSEDGALYLCGNSYDGGAYSATVWRSTDEGANWTEYHVDESQYRIYAMLDVGGYLWVQTLSTNSPAATAHKTSNGTTWTTTTVNLTPQGYGTPWRPWTVGSVAAYLTNPGIGTGRGITDLATPYLATFDGTTVDELTELGAVYDHYFDGTTLYVLTQAGDILTTTDLDTFDTLIDDAPSTARSICVIDGAVYVGTTTSHLWVYS